MKKSVVLILCSFLALAVFLTYKVHVFFRVWGGGVEQQNVGTAFRSLTNRMIILETFSATYDASSGPCVIVRDVNETDLCQSRVEIRTYDQSSTCYPANIIAKRINGYYPKEGEFVVHIFAQSRYAALENGLYAHLDAGQAPPWSIDELNFQSNRLNKVGRWRPYSPWGLGQKGLSECGDFFVYTYGE
ncbi:hypothetical protein [Pseudophaeobacter leonis]|uniref:hypothetical protein n=1 Tax=Pseudophaeobacter leonis TaxID=1144477 RepID=UPI0009F2AC81|nr:hypothetical protein [Pseudophaeobacter leonis]